jgi:polyphosphate kinase 2 (PPK2 family)
MVDTWREDYPYAERLGRDEYEHQKRLLQVELLKLQYWIQDSGCRIVVLFEGRDAAGKGSTIKRGNGISSATWSICRPPVRSSSSTAPGTTAPGSRR